MHALLSVPLPALLPAFVVHRGMRVPASLLRTAHKRNVPIALPLRAPPNPGPRLNYTYPPTHPPALVTPSPSLPPNPSPLPRWCAAAWASPLPR